MSINTYFKSDWNVICDVCGRKRKRSECKLSYGVGIIPIIIACTDTCADELHPLNFPPPVIQDSQPVPDARPEATDVFIGVIGSTQRWGKFHPKTTWSHFNDGNYPHQLDGYWTWGSFI